MISCNDNQNGKRRPSLTVIVSRGQSRAPEKRQLEAAIAEAAGAVPGVTTLSIPHLYDLPPGGETIQQLRSIPGDLLVLSWIYPRAAHWVLDRAGIRGQYGEVQLKEAEEEDDDAESMDENPLESRVTDAAPRPDRHIYSLDLRLESTAQPYLAEIRRIATLAGEATPPSGRSASDPLAHPAIGVPAPSAPASALPSAGLFKIEEPTSRRWYPVIDFSRCTNCMECIDFCLFGVYGVDNVETILVEQPDNCRKGCPACSRVCPANAIIFPQHKAPAIAGAPVDDGIGLKIDLSLLFGAPDKDEDPIATAARERDEQLLLAGRSAVGMEVGIPKRQTDRSNQPKDELDSLLDELDALDL